MNKPFRIALVAGGTGLGGATTFLINFAGELVRRGLPAKVISFEREKTPCLPISRSSTSRRCAWISGG